ncbi:hypothetical protein BDE02_12G033800 [Populus trichocarpa]|nr:hypothetical protein BDE02_12G033800 [Populus trichocarpa]
MDFYAFYVWLPLPHPVTKRHETQLAPMVLAETLARSKRNIIPCVPDGWTASTLADHLKVGDVRVFEMMKVVRAHLEFKFSEWSPLTRLEIPWMKDQIGVGVSA